MKKAMLFLLLTLLSFGSSISAQAKQQTVSVWSPAKGVLCDRYMCANDKEGVSRELTERYVGKKAVTKLYSEGSFDPTGFTFINGIYCDVNERRCYVDRYYECDADCGLAACGADHCHHSAVSAKYTKLLFGIVVH